MLLVSDVNRCRLGIHKNGTTMTISDLGLRNLDRSVMLKRRYYCVLFLVYLCPLIAQSTSSIRASEISQYEAELLVYFSPDLVRTRERGSEVELHRSSKENSDYYYFEAYNRTNSGVGSATIGHYAVNRHTAEIWLAVPKMLIMSSELKCIQEVLRRAHHISEETMKLYGGARL